MFIARATAAEPSLPELGIGITHSATIEPLLERYPGLVDVIEVEPQTDWIETGDDARPYRVADAAIERLARLAGHKLVHSIAAPVGGTVRPHPAQLTLLRRLVDRFGSPWASEHLSFNATPEHGTGLFLPPRQNAAGVMNAVAAIRGLQRALQVPVAVEPGISHLRPRPDELPDGAFIAAVIDTAECGLLLDLHNLWVNQRNGRQAVDAFLSQVPLDRVWELHLAGGLELGGYYLNVHSSAIPGELIALARRVVPALPNLKAIVFETRPSFVPLGAFDMLRDQLEALRPIWQRRGRAVGDGIPWRDRVRPALQMVSHGPAPREWEQALGGLAVGRAPKGPVARELAEDPGVPVVSRLVEEARAAMVERMLRLTTRLLRLALGDDGVVAILRRFWAETPPRQFAVNEAIAFAAHLAALDLPVPHLAKLLEFEQAVLATLVDETPRLVVFATDPLPLFRALSESRLPDTEGEPGRYEIAITPNGPVPGTGVDAATVQEAIAFP